MRLDEFSGKTVVVTGAGGGLGSALVEALKMAGAKVTACDLTFDSLSGQHDVRKHFFDLTDEEATARVARTLLAEDGAPDILINNAGWTTAESMKSLTTRSIAAEIAMNLTGVSVFSSMLVAAMADRGRGAVVFVSSVNALAHFGNPAYSAAKAGIEAISRAIAVEHGRHGVRSNTVCPGSIRTPAWDKRIARDPAVMGRLARLYPIGRIIECNEVVEAILFLASGRASAITGVTLPVDGGLMAGSRTFIDEIVGADPA